MSELIKKIKSRGYWQVIITPNKYQEDLIESFGKCKEIIQEVQVRLRGWYYPFYSYNQQPINRTDYIELESEWSYFLEYWRYYLNGMFIQFFGMIEDWQDQAREGAAWQIPPNSLSIISTLYTFTEIYEFASRLANKELLGEECTISIGLYGTKHRQLVMLESWRHLSGTYKCYEDNLVREKLYNTKDLISRAAELALEHTVWVFQRFNWDNVPISVLKQDQDKLLSGTL